jgi:ribosomal-protein-alanine N-acetyltransferase
MRVTDLDEVMVIEDYSFPTPWRRHMYESDLRTNSHSRFFVLRDRLSGELAGYIGSWFIYEEAHVGTIATKQEHRGLHLAEQLLAYTALQADMEGLNYIILEVRTSNIAAIRLYERLGFQQVGLRPRSVNVAPVAVSVMSASEEMLCHDSWSLFSTNLNDPN